MMNFAFKMMNVSFKTTDSDRLARLPLRSTVSFTL